MGSREFEELAGRIEGLGRLVLAVIADLEDREMLNGVRFCRSLRSTAEMLSFDRRHLEATKRTLQETADALDGARRQRQESGGREGSRRGRT